MGVISVIIWLLSLEIKHNIGICNSESSQVGMLQGFILVGSEYGVYLGGTQIGVNLGWVKVEVNFVGISMGVNLSGSQY